MTRADSESLRPIRRRQRRLVLQHRGVAITALKGVHRQGRVVAFDIIHDDGQDEKEDEQVLTPATIENLDLGELQRTINAALAEVALDVHARPDVQKPRTITIKISLTPELSETPAGLQNYPEITYQVRTEKPAKAVTGMRGFIGVDEATGEIQLLVNRHLPDAADDPRQQHIFDLSQRKEQA